ncbi:MAG: hypothetical protein QNK05_17190 [Myxococcota bacterium]|nr:hypothetical protein [Myxococcota bacterium]
MRAPALVLPVVWFWIGSFLAASLPAAADEAEAPAADEAEAPAAAEAPAFTMGNGDVNWIVTEGARRDGATFTFSEVRIDGNGWLVMHPFKDGKPVGEVYVGATYLEDGENRDVEITVDSVPEPGTMFIVMLHLDVNENRVFDFVFVDERNVLDKAVFEGTKMIAHAIAAPE